MSYTCKNCNYNTDNKSNFNRHNKSTNHKRKSNIESKLTRSVKGPTDDANKLALNCKKTNLYICRCKKEFHHASSLSRHKQKCDIIQNKILMGELEINELKEQLKKYENVVEKCEGVIQKYEEMHKELINTVKTSNKGNTYISVKNYIQTNYSSAPPLTKLNDYSLLEQSNNTLIDDIVYNFDHSLLDQYLGTFLINQYKKDDLSQQSIWNSDVARMTYIINELLCNKKTSWNHDYKGIKTKEYIVIPLLEYIKKYIQDYLKNSTVNFMKLSHNECEKIMKTQVTLGQTLQYINTTLGDDIVKYISPYFHLNKFTDTILDNNFKVIEL